MEGPPEGIFSVELNYINEYQIPNLLRSQIKEYPCSLKIIHLDGPPVEGLAVTIYSAHELRDVLLRQSDEAVKPRLEDQNRKLQINVQNLRKNSVIELGFSSIGIPDLRKNIVMSKGRLLGVHQVAPKNPWYKSEYFVVPSLLLGSGILILSLFYSLRRYAEPHMLRLTNDRFKIYAAVAASVAILPVYSEISLVFVIYALVKIFHEISMVRQFMQGDYKTPKNIENQTNG